MRHLVVRLVAVLLALALLELGVRIVAVAVAGPRVLLYGTPWHHHHVAPPGAARGVEFHSVEENGYTKYFPHEEKWANDSRGHYRVRINDHGLRGPDFDDVKRPGIRRVLTLGASSTFGFENRDDETYRTISRRRSIAMQAAGSSRSSTSPSRTRTAMRS